MEQQTDDLSAAYSIGYLETWIEKVGKEFELDVSSPLANLGVVEKQLASLRHTTGAQKVQLDAHSNEQALQKGKATSAKKREGSVVIEGGEAFDVANVFLAQRDSAHRWIGVCYQFNEEHAGPVLETVPWRMALTAEELSLVSDYIQLHKGKLPAIRSKSLPSLDDD